MSLQPTPSPAQTSTTPLRKAALFTPYVVVWTMFGVLSVGLLGVLGLAPEWLDDLRPTVALGDQSHHGQRVAARLTAELNALKDSVAKVQLDLAKVSTDVDQQGQTQKSISAQMAALEARVQSPAATATEAATAPLQSAPAPAASEPARTPKVINAEATTPPTTPSAAAPATIETGSVAPAKAASAPISFGPAIVKPAPQPFGIKLSSGASQDSLRLSWSLLAEKYGDALKGLEARSQTGGDAANPNYDLIAGPLKNKAEAAKACKVLVAKGVPCSVVGSFGGDAL